MRFSPKCDVTEDTIIQESLCKWESFFQTLDTYPRNRTDWEIPKVSEENGTLLTWIVEICHQRPEFKMVAAKEWSDWSENLDLALQEYTPKSRHNATNPTVGTRRKEFHGNPVCDEYTYIVIYE